MKVLHLFQEYLSVSESWLFNMINAMNNVQHTIGAIYWNKNLEYFSQKFQFIPNQEPVDLRLLYKDYHTIGKIKQLKLKAKRRISKQEFHQIKAWTKNNNTDLIHVHFGTTGAHFIDLLKQLNIPFIVSFYGYDYQKAVLDQPKLANKYLQVFEEAKAILIEEESGRDKLIKLSCPKQKIEVCRLGVNVSKIKYRKPNFTAKVKLVQIANFNSKKGQSDVVKAIAKHYASLKDQISITFIGDCKTPYGRSVKKQVDQMNLNDVVSFLPTIPYSSVHSVMTKYDVFIHPSRFSEDGDSEGGAPTILLDAQAVGLPIISTKHCDIPNYVPSVNHKLLAEEKDIDKLHEIINLLINNDALAQKSSIEGRVYIEEKFNLETNGSVLEEKYKSLITS